MLRPGGTAIIPVHAAKSDGGYLPDRQLTYWPYSRMDDSRLELRDGFALIHARNAVGMFKIGAALPAGWLAYLLEGLLFVKRFRWDPGKTYPDLGCNAECFVCNDYLELESLGPMLLLEPGESVQHDELWEVFADPAQRFLPEGVLKALSL